MPRASTKEDLIKAANEQFEKLEALIAAMPEKVQDATFNFDADFLQKQTGAHWTRDKNLRDVLIHLYEWHKLLINWISDNQRGEAKPFLPEPYNWKTYPKMNEEFWQAHQSTTGTDAKSLLRESHKKALALIDGFSDDELFSKKHFSWTGTTTLGSYCISATSSHYDWAIKKLRQHLKSSSAELDLVGRLKAPRKSS